MSHAIATARLRGPSVFVKFALLMLLTVTFVVISPRTHVRPLSGPFIQFDLARDFFRMSMAPAPLRKAAAAPSSDTDKISAAMAAEMAMSPKQLLDRWKPLIAEASKRFRIPAAWIRAVIRQESGGRTVSSDGTPLTSAMGAMGLMQLLPGTYNEMRDRYGLGDDPYNAHDNIFAGAAYLKWLRHKYGYPAMFAAYNDGPGNFEQSRAHRHSLPPETLAYVAGITAHIRAARRHGHVA